VTERIFFVDCLSRTQVTPDQIRNLAYEIRDITRAQALRRAQARGLRIKLLSDKAKSPAKQSDKAAGYDLPSVSRSMGATYCWGIPRGIELGLGEIGDGTEGGRLRTRGFLAEWSVGEMGQ